MWRQKGSPDAGMFRLFRHFRRKQTAEKLQDSIREDAGLLQRIAKGDADAEKRFCEKYQQEMLFYLEMRGIRDPEAAQDICQQALMEVLEAARDKKIRYLHGFALIVCRNKISAYLRALQKRREKFESLNEEGGIDPPADEDDEESENSAKEEMRKKVHAVWPKLSPEDQQILELRYVEEWSSEKVAQFLGMTRSQVLKRAQRAKDMICGRKRRSPERRGHNLSILILFW